jgi:hypothetical protein
MTALAMISSICKRQACPLVTRKMFSLKELHVNTN